MNSKNIQILDYIVQFPDGLALTQIMEHTGLSKTTVYRTLQNMVHAKLIHRLGRQYFLGPVMLRWMNTEQSKQKIVHLIHPYLVEISREIVQTVHLVQRQGNKAMYIDKINGSHTILLASQIGAELELYSTGAGRAILASLTDSELDAYFTNTVIVKRSPYTQIDLPKLKEEIYLFRKQGYALEVEQNEKDIQCVGVHMYLGGVELAISITTTVLVELEKLKAMGEYLRNKKKKMIQDLDVQ